MSDEALNKKIEEQSELLKQIVEQNKKTQRHLRWLRIWGIIKLVVIVTPIVLALVYLPPFLRKAFDKYKEFSPALEKIDKLIECAKEVEGQPDQNQTTQPWLLLKNLV